MIIFQCKKQRPQKADPGMFGSSRQHELPNCYCGMIRCILLEIDSFKLSELTKKRATTPLWHGELAISQLKMSMARQGGACLGILQSQHGIQRLEHIQS